jgi:transcriptional regulator with XRE-family HTH domain
VDKDALATFLRSRREALRPADVGLTAEGVRRTPGLRREEVSELAGLSADHYERLERGRAGPLSAGGVDALARALRLDAGEFAQLCRLAGLPERPGSRPYQEPGLTFLLDGLSDVPVWAQDDATRIMAFNPLAGSVFGGLPEPGDPRSAIGWQWFVEPGWRRMVLPADQEDISIALVTELRITLTWRGAAEDPVSRLVEDLRHLSADFARLWERETLVPFKALPVTMDHPVGGRLELTCDMLRFWTGHLVKLLRPRPGTPAAERLGQLRSGLGHSLAGR